MSIGIMSVEDQDGIIKIMLDVLGRMGIFNPCVPPTAEQWAEMVDVIRRQTGSLHALNATMLEFCSSVDQLRRDVEVIARSIEPDDSDSWKNA